VRVADAHVDHKSSGALGAKASCMLLLTFGNSKSN